MRDFEDLEDLKKVLGNAYCRWEAEIPPAMARFNKLKVKLIESRPARGAVDTEEWLHQNIRSFFFSAFRCAITCEEILKFYRDRGLEQFYTESRYILLHLNFDAMNSLIVNLYNFRRSMCDYTENVLFVQIIDHVWERINDARDSVVHAHDRNFGISGFQRNRKPIQGLQYGQMKNVIGTIIDLMDKNGKPFSLNIDPSSFCLFLSIAEESE